MESPAKRPIGDPTGAVIRPMLVPTTMVLSPVPFGETVSPEGYEVPYQ